MHCPFDYSLCCQRVTIYRPDGQQIHRQVLDNCYLEYSTRVETDENGKQLKRPFLLIVAGDVQLFPDDRIYDGVGPVILPEQWQSFIPANRPRLMQVQYVQPCFWNGRQCHVEAGRKSSMFSY